ncbi:MAG: hypothetical protein V4664_00580 [Patescibacteria group bacterium]
MATNNSSRVGVKVPTENMILIAAIGFIAYFGIGWVLYSILNNYVFEVPDGKFGAFVNWVYAILWAIAWLMGWDRDKSQRLAQGEFGTVWLLGFYTGFLLPGGPYWKAPDWVMRVKALPAVVITTMYPETFVNTTGHGIKDGKKPGVVGGSVVELKAKIAFQWFIHPQHVARVIAKIQAEWSKEIDWVQAQKILQDTFSGKTLAKIRTSAASMSYQEVFDSHLDTPDEDGAKKTDKIIDDLQDDNLLLSIGVLAYQVAFEKVEAGSQKLKDSLAGEAEEEGELKRQKRDTATFHEIMEDNYRQLVDKSKWPADAQRTRDEAYRLALLMTGKMLAINPIEVSGDKSGGTRLQVNAGTR